MYRKIIRSEVLIFELHDLIMISNHEINKL